MKIVEGIGTLQFQEGLTELRLGGMVEPPVMVEFVDDENHMYKVPKDHEEAYVEIPLEQESVLAVSVYGRKVVESSLAITRPGGMYEILPMLIGVKATHLVKMPPLNDEEALCVMFNGDCQILVESSRPRQSPKLANFKPLPRVEPEDGPTLMTEADVRRIVREAQLGEGEVEIIDSEESMTIRPTTAPDEDWETDPCQLMLLAEDQEEEEDDDDASTDGERERSEDDDDSDEEVHDEIGKQLEEPQGAEEKAGEPAGEQSHPGEAAEERGKG